MARERITFEQKEYIVTFMEIHPDFCHNKFVGTEGRIVHSQLWVDLSNSLNELGGPTRTVVKWQKAWSDLKQKIKRKQSLIHAAQTGTGGGPHTPAPITDFEQRILNLISNEAVYSVKSEEGMDAGVDGPVMIQIEQVMVNENVEASEHDIEMDGDSDQASEASSRASTSSTHSHRRNRQQSEVAADKFEEIGGRLNKEVKKLVKISRAIVNEQKRSNELTEQMLSERKLTNALLSSLIEVIRDGNNPLV